MFTRQKILLVGLLIISLTLIRLGTLRAETKIGVVNVNEVFSGYNRVEESQKEFDRLKEERQAVVQKKADQIEKEIKPLKEKLDKQGKALKKEEADKLKAEIETKNQEILKFQREVYQELQKKNRELVEERIKEITEAIARVAGEKGYGLIVNKEAVLYSPEASDLSDEVLKILNKETPKKAEPGKSN